MIADQHNKFKAWVAAARPRTLPLAIASVGMGIFLAYDSCKPRTILGAFMIVLTTVFLQILSNLANDYGDSIHGADHAGRTGPLRMVQSGKLTLREIRLGIFLLSTLAFLSGTLLLLITLGLTPLSLAFLLLGIGAIWAAYNYTAGRKPYGYSGWGDFFVFLFFGLTGVLGSYTLLCYEMVPSLLLPAISVGTLATAVLNLNNIRDMKSDEHAGKITIPVRLGLRGAKRYHFALLSLAVVAAAAYTVLEFEHEFQWLFLAVLPLLFKNAMAVQKLSLDALRDIDPYLKQLALTTLLFVVLFGVGLLV